MGGRRSHFLGVLHAQVRRKEEVMKKGKLGKRFQENKVRKLS